MKEKKLRKLLKELTYDELIKLLDIDFELESNHLMPMLILNIKFNNKVVTGWNIKDQVWYNEPYKFKQIKLKEQE